MKLWQIKQIISKIEEEYGEGVEIFLKDKVDPFFYEILSADKEMQLDYILMQPKLCRIRTREQYE